MIVGLHLVPVLLVLARGGSSAAESLCPVGDFDSQTQQLLSSQLMTRDELANLSTVFYDLQETLQMKWPGSEVFPVGSVLTGLTMKWSDGDCMVKVPYYNIYNITTSRHLIQTAVTLLNRHPEIYHNVRAKYRKKNKVDLLKFLYVPTQRGCDMNFIDTNALDNSRIIGHYYSLDNRAFILAAIIKIWAKILRRNGKSLTSYVWHWLIIFYLQQEQILPSYYVLQKDMSQHSVAELNGVRYLTDNSKSVYQLLGGFFKYYSEFNFEEYVVSPFLARAVPKKEFENVDSLPEELSLYKRYTKQPNSKVIDLHTTPCIQDVFLQYVNIAETTPRDRYENFLWHVKFVGRAFELIPKDMFLRAILTEDTYSDGIENVIHKIPKVNGCKSSSS